MLDNVGADKRDDGGEEFERQYAEWMAIFEGCPEELQGELVEAVRGMWERVRIDEGE